MAIDTSGEWWKGSEAADIDEYLRGYADEGLNVDAFRLCRCSCGSTIFSLDTDGDEGVARRTCAQCAKVHMICDSAEYWDEAKPDPYRCVECGSQEANVGVGFSLYPEDGDVRYLYVGERCVRCGILGCMAEWKVACSPSSHLLDQV